MPELRRHLPADRRDHQRAPGLPVNHSRNPALFVLRYRGLPGRAVEPGDVDNLPLVPRHRHEQRADDRRRRLPSHHRDVLRVRFPSSARFLRNVVSCLRDRARPDAARSRRYECWLWKKSGTTLFCLPVTFEGWVKYVFFCFPSLCRRVHRAGVGLRLDPLPEWRAVPRLGSGLRAGLPLHLHPGKKAERPVVLRSAMYDCLQ